MTSYSDRNSRTDKNLPVWDVVPVEQMAGEDEEDTALLRLMLNDARNYILAFAWCDSILESYFAAGVGKILAIFLFKISTTNPEVPPWEWVVVGDIPSAYLPLEDCPSSKAVFHTYLEGMGRWVALAREGREAGPADGIPPVNVPATFEWAEDLDGRLRLLKKLLQPHFEDGTEK